MKIFNDITQTYKPKSRSNGGINQGMERQPDSVEEHKPEEKCRGGGRNG